LAAAEAEGLRCGRRVALCDENGALNEQLAAGTVVSAWHGSDLVALARIESGSLQPLRVINK